MNTRQYDASQYLILRTHTHSQFTNTHTYPHATPEACPYSTESLPSSLHSLEGIEDGHRLGDGRLLDVEDDGAVGARLGDA